MFIDTVIANRIRNLRKTQGLTLEQLADSSGVSRSMISLIERQETSPTAAVLNKLADALGVSLPELFAEDTQAAAPVPVARRSEQTVWTDPASGYVRRHLSPTGIDSPIELVEVEFPAGETVVFDNPTRKVAIHQQLWVLNGAIDITTNAQTWHLSYGDCLAVDLGERITFHNPTDRPARYVLALASSNDIFRKPI